MRLAGTGMRRGLNKATNNPYNQLHAPPFSLAYGSGNAVLLRAMHTREKPSKEIYYARKRKMRRENERRLSFYSKGCIHPL
jgi:hypothetical protein